MKKRTNNKKGLHPPTQQLSVTGEQDLIAVRACGREMADAMGFSKNDQTLVATALSEIGRNILQFAGAGEITLKVVHRKDKKGLIITANDDGPGIDDIEKALTDGFSTGKGMGMGLPGVQRIMDEFTIESQVGNGTTVTMSKWQKPS